MLDKMEKSIDAVTISTPDHSHAAVALQAMRMGKHCFCQMPLAHSIYESRLLGKTARNLRGFELHEVGQPRASCSPPQVAEVSAQTAHLCSCPNRRRAIGRCIRGEFWWREIAGGVSEPRAVQNRRDSSEHFHRLAKWRGLGDLLIVAQALGARDEHPRSAIRRAVSSASLIGRPSRPSLQMIQRGAHADQRLSARSRWRFI